MLLLEPGKDSFRMDYILRSLESLHGISAINLEGRILGHSWKMHSDAVLTISLHYILKYVVNFRIINGFFYLFPKTLLAAGIL